MLPLRTSGTSSCCAARNCGGTPAVWLARAMVSVHAMKGTQMKKRSQMVSITNGAMIRIIGIDRAARKGTPAAARSNIYGNSMGWVEFNWGMDVCWRR